MGLVVRTGLILPVMSMLPTSSALLSGLSRNDALRINELFDPEVSDDLCETLRTKVGVRHLLGLYNFVQMFSSITIKVSVTEPEHFHSNHHQLTDVVP